YLSWLGIKINDEANTRNATIINESDSTVLVGVIPTNEELMIAQHVRSFLNI
ncbi:acetate kinase, partial [Pseudomonas syringae pv. pisi]